MSQFTRKSLVTCSINQQNNQGIAKQFKTVQQILKLLIQSGFFILKNKHIDMFRPEKELRIFYLNIAIRMFRSRTLANKTQRAISNVPTFLSSGQRLSGLCMQMVAFSVHSSPPGEKHNTVLPFNLYQNTCTNNKQME